MRCTSLVFASFLLLHFGPLACGGDPSAEDEGAATSSESGEQPETGETSDVDPICEASETLLVTLTGPFGTDSPTDAPLLQALSYVSQTAGLGSASDCPCGVDCTGQPVGVFEFNMFGLASLPSCFTVEYAVRADASEGAWIVFRNAEEGSAGELMLAAGSDPATIPPSLSGFAIEGVGETACADFQAVRVRYSFGDASIELENGESGELETPMGAMTIYNRGSMTIAEGADRYGWIMVPAGTVLGE